MPNYTAREGLSIVVEKDKKSKTKTVGGSLPPDDYSANNPRESDEVYAEMKSSGKTFDEIHKEMEEEQRLEDAEGGAFDNLVKSVSNMSAGKLNTIKDLSSHLWTVNKDGFHKGVLVDICKAKNSKHLGEMMKNDKAFHNENKSRYVDGAFHKTLKKTIDISSNL